MKFLIFLQILFFFNILLLLGNCASNVMESIAIDNEEITLDTDEDGVLDELDSCNTTPAGALVDALGCRIINEYNPNYFLIWQDEFSEEGNVNGTKWHHQIIAPNNGSWFNGEKQHYTDRVANSYVRDGVLIIKAI